MKWKYHFIFINEGFYIVISAKYWCYILTNILTTNHISFLFPTKYNVTIIPSPCEVNCILKVEKLLCAAVHNIHIYSDNLLMLHLLRECRAAHRLTLLEKNGHLVSEIPCTRSRGLALQGGVVVHKKKRKIENKSPFSCRFFWHFYAKLWIWFSLMTVISVLLRWPQKWLVYLSEIPATL